MRPRSQRDCLAIDEFVLAAGARDRFRADHAGVVFQMFNLLPYLSARDNILLACRFSAARRARLRARNTTPAAELARLADLELDALQDNDPRAMELMQRMREEWDRAPVVERFSGQQVRIPGFVVPLESDGRTIREFLLVPYFGACVHVPPPPANQLIHVIPDQPIAAGLNMSPVWVNGVLNVGRVESEMGSAGYQMRAMKVEAYTEPLPR